MSPRIDNAVSPTTPGAGRSFSYDITLFGPVSINSEPNNFDQLAGRPNGLTQASSYARTINGTTPTPRGAQLYKGRVCWRMTTSPTTGYQLVPSFAGVNRPLAMPFCNAAQAWGSAAQDDFAVWEFSSILAFDAMPGAVTGDIGITIGVGTRAQIRTGSQFAGIEFGPVNAAGQIGVFARQADAGAVTINNDLIPNLALDTTEFHKYSIRLLSGNATTPARMKFLVDDQTQLTYSYGVGTLLPDQWVGGAGNIGFTPGLISNLASASGNTAMYVAQQGTTIKSAPNEDALL